MSDIMRQIPFGELMDWVLTEYKEHKTIFGVRKLWFSKGDKELSIFNEKLETPFGPAAGPHTQLAQNIIASYVAGSRFFELKTVQKLDGEDLPVAKPCITAADECYNCEWSTELYVPQALEEYIKGWFALKLLSREFGFGNPNGFVFNMSVGYDLEGIKLKKIDDYIEGMKEAGGAAIWKECVRWAKNNTGKFKNIDDAYIDGISSKASHSITLSTLHGCPPDEIERIATYLITEKRLNTFIKCNPTLLDYKYARDLLDSLGFDYVAFDDHHFKADLQFEDAVPMLKRLMGLADSNGLVFGVKLTNTFPVKVMNDELPSGEMYMSGRSLYPLSMSVANLLSKAFGGKLRISYSGGADIYNIGKIIDAGIWPVTIATTLLKPGGYDRIAQMAQELYAHEYKDFTGVDIGKVEILVSSVKGDKYYKKAIKPAPERKMKSKVPLMDCFEAPCRDGCPIGQDIPAYLRLAGEGKYLEGLRVITERNPLPFITGTICAHRCMDKCTRVFYEESVHIRAVKLETAEKAYDALLFEIKKPESKAGKIAVVGGGAAGISAAYFLQKKGFQVTIFEKRDTLGGIVRHVIPGFRIGDEAIEKDIALMKALGVEIVTGREIKSIEELKGEGFAAIILATGAWKPQRLPLKYGEAKNVLEFLEEFKTSPKSVRLGKNVVIVGGGNTAMDAARAAKRVHGVEKVSIVYRRDKRNMPADEEELQLALDDGVEFCGLLSPVGLKDGVLHCVKMVLSKPDESGRRKPVETDETAEVLADTVIAAIGELVDTQFYAGNNIKTDAKGKALVSDKTLETSISGVYVIGDAMRGPATVVEAVADAAKAASAVSGAGFDKYESLNLNQEKEASLVKRGILFPNSCDTTEPKRCLECKTICENCADVCPNRANVAIMLNGRPQIIHVDYMCNECGNCEVFCPYSSAPYKDKFTLFKNEKDFLSSQNEGFLPLDGGRARVRLDGEVQDCDVNANALPEDINGLIKAVISNYSYII
ncbi:MAG: putative selenate reductase subunit YgfK [Oscillospiraceae bacterium]|nr:putative selenate reductase subunit YgfK [Oscillospiraceae bacterium]